MADLCTAWIGVATPRAGELLRFVACAPDGFNVEAGQTMTPLVSVCCITYNHAPYIADALEGFVSQRTDFPVEVLVHDDASTDGTAEILRRYEARYPELIKPIYQTENQYSQGKRPSHSNYARARGRYIALCEGDDYWRDPLKLQKQVDALEGAADVELCFHSAECITVDGKGERRKIIGRYAQGPARVRVEDIISRPYGMLPTASCVVTRNAIEKVMRFREAHPELRVGDVMLQIMAALSGGAVYLDEPMSVYRHKLPGSWTSMHGESAAGKVRYASDRVRVLEGIDEATDGHYHELLSRENRRWILRIGRTRVCSLRDKARFYRAFGDRLEALERVRYLSSMLLGAGQAIHRRRRET